MAAKFGSYRILRRIASGGMGEVCLAVLEKESGFTKTVALKTMLPTAEYRDDFVELFESEAVVAAMLNHPNIVQIFDHGCVDGKTYLTMEFVEGPDLAALISVSGSKPFPLAVAAEVAIQLGRGLSHAHERKDLRGRAMGIVHGDVSPSNILISTEGQVKLADFGLARIRGLAVERGLIVGKYSYMSPEQANGIPLGACSDIFSLGLVVYEMFTASRAYPLKTPPAETLADIRNGAHTPAAQLQPQLPESLVLLLDRALAREPGDRFSSVNEMTGALSRACAPCGPEKLSEFVKRFDIQGCGSAHLAPEPTQVARRPICTPGTKRRRQTSILLTSVFIVVLLAGLGWWLFLWLPGSDQVLEAPSLLQAPTDRLAKAIGSPEKPKPLPRVAKTSSTSKSRSSPTSAKQQPNILPKSSPKPRSPRLIFGVDSSFRTFVNHQPVQGTKFQVTDLRPQLIHLIPRQADHPRINIRLNPPEELEDAWRLAINSTPWMNILVDKQPVGQTPRANLRFRPGRHGLVLHRDGLSIRMDLYVQAGE